MIWPLSNNRSASPLGSGAAPTALARNLFAYIAAVAAHHGFTDTFRGELVNAKTLRVPVGMEPDQAWSARLAAISSASPKGGKFPHTKPARLGYAFPRCFCASEPFLNRMLSA